MKKYNYLIFLLIILLLIFMTGCGTTPSKPVINSFTANPLIITAGESSTLAWNVSDATSVSINQGVGSSLALSSSASVFPTATTTYTLTATNAAGTVTATVQVTLSTTTYTVTFDSQGGSTVSSQTVEDDGLVTESTAPTKEGYTFGGWYKESGCTNAWDFATDTVTADVTLYAKWTPLYALRDTGPAGGWIFYVKAGGYSDGWMYLEVAPSDQSTGAFWGCYGLSISGADGTAVGTGEQNTLNIEVGCTTVGIAADTCANLTIIYGVYGFDDWFLPSKDELNLMYENLKVAGIGGFADKSYWSSSEITTDHAWAQYFGSGGQKVDAKIWEYRVRAVRAF